jgi:hypothetical protein
MPVASNMAGVISAASKRAALMDSSRSKSYTLEITCPASFVRYSSVGSVVVNEPVAPEIIFTSSSRRSLRDCSIVMRKALSCA